MKYTTLTRGTAAAVLALGLAACSGGGGGGGTPTPQPNPNNQVLGSATMGDITDRTGAPDGQRKEADSVAVVGYAAPTGGTGDLRTVRAGVTFNSRDDRPEMIIDLDRDGNGTYELGRNDEDLSNAFDLFPGESPQNRTNENFTVSRGGRTIQVARQVGYQPDGITPDYDRQAVVYVPADDAQEMYGGLVAQTDPAPLGQAGGSAMFATFGKRTDEGDMPGAAAGTVNYIGQGSAFVNRSSDSGVFDGAVTGTVDFGNRSLTTDGRLVRHENGDEIHVETSGTFFSPGGGSSTKVTGSSTTTIETGVDAGTVMSGNMSGQFYGPNAETLGLTYRGENTGAGANTVGGQILNAQ